MHRLTKSNVGKVLPPFPWPRFPAVAPAPVRNGFSITKRAGCYRCAFSTLLRSGLPGENLRHRGTGECKKFHRARTGDGSRRTRPTGGISRSDFFDGGSSFPSGHSIEAWSLATVIAHEYHDRLAVQIAAYGIASAVSVSRFTGRNHYLSDVLVGSALGYGIGRYVYHAHHRRNAAAGGGGDEEEVELSRSKWRPAIAPLYSRRAHDYGVAMAWSF